MLNSSKECYLLILAIYIITYIIALVQHFQRESILNSSKYSNINHQVQISSYIAFGINEDSFHYNKAMDVHDI